MKKIICFEKAKELIRLKEKKIYEIPVNSILVPETKEEKAIYEGLKAKFKKYAKKESLD